MLFGSASSAKLADALKNLAARTTAFAERRRLFMGACFRVAVAAARSAGAIAPPFVDVSRRRGRSSIEPPHTETFAAPHRPGARQTRDDRQVPSTEPLFVGGVEPAPRGRRLTYVAGTTAPTERSSSQATCTTAASVKKMGLERVAVLPVLKTEKLSVDRARLRARAVRSCIRQDSLPISPFGKNLLT